MGSTGLCSDRVNGGALKDNLRRPLACGSAVHQVGASSVDEPRRSMFSSSFWEQRRALERASLSLSISLFLKLRAAVQLLVGEFLVG